MAAMDPLRKARVKKELKRSSIGVLDVLGATGHAAILAAPAPLPVKAASIAGLINFVRELF